MKILKYLYVMISIGAIAHTAAMYLGRRALAREGVRL